MSVTATCIYCERRIELSIENQWFDSGGNFLCGDGSHIGHPHVPSGLAIGVTPRNCGKSTQEPSQRTSTDTNLNALSEATKGMNELERSEFDNFFIGALTVKVSREEWDEAIRTARRCCADRWARSPLR